MENLNINLLIAFIGVAVTLVILCTILCLWCLKKLQTKSNGNAKKSFVVCDDFQEQLDRSSRPNRDCSLIKFSLACTDDVISIAYFDDKRREFCFIPEDYGDEDHARNTTQTALVVAKKLPVNYSHGREDCASDPNYQFDQDEVSVQEKQTNQNFERLVAELANQDSSVDKSPSNSTLRPIENLEQNRPEKTADDVDDSCGYEGQDQESDERWWSKRCLKNKTSELQELQYSSLKSLGWKEHLRRFFWNDRWFPPPTRIRLYTIGFDATVPFCERCGNRPREEFFVGLQTWVCERCADILQRTISPIRSCEICRQRPAEELFVSTNAWVCYECAGQLQREMDRNNDRPF